MHHMSQVMIGSWCMLLWNWWSIQETILSASGSKRAIICPSISLKIVSCKWSDAKSYNEPLGLTAFSAFWFLWPMIQLEELLTRLVVYNDSPTHWPLIQCTGHDSHGVSWVSQLCLCFWRLVLPLHHHHPQLHVAMRWGSRVSASVWQVCTRIF